MTLHFFIQICLALQSTFEISDAALEEVLFSNPGKTHLPRLGWRRRAIALACSRTRHIKNTCAVCRMTETLQDVLPHLCMIH